MKKYLLYIFTLCCSIGVHAQGEIILSNKNTTGGVYTACNSIRLTGSFSFSATATGKSLMLKVSPVNCDPFGGKDMDLTTVKQQNYIRTKTYLSDDGSRYLDQIQYFDGLGRPIQNVQRAITPAGKDIVTHQEYDNIGRENKSWLPAVVSGNDGAFVSLAKIKTPQAIYKNDSRPFVESVHELSPLNRVEKQYGAGNMWKTADKKVETNYLTNNSTYPCTLYAVGGTRKAPTLENKGNYANGQLFVTQVKDEDGNTAYEFKDKQDQVVLTRQMNGIEQLDTYYVYDKWGNLCFVLPPRASTKEHLDLLGYQYRYDDKNRCISKKIPGADWVFFVYDKIGHLIFTQDGEQRTKKEWSFSIPDAFGRIVLTGICKNTITDDLTYLNYVVVSSQFNLNNSTNKYYDIEGVYLSNPTILSANYYDNYDFITKGDFVQLAYDEQSGYGTKYQNNKGLLTGSMTALLDGSGKFLYTTLFYDYKGNMIQSKSTNHLGGLEKVYLAYTFTGNPTKKLHIHTATGKTTQREQYTYEYDHAERLINTKHKLNSGAEFLLTHNTYDELGRLQTTTANNQNKLRTSYTYNIRSWSEKINHDQFNQTLAYYYNGNIKTQQWVQEGKIRNYTFEYDGLSQLKKATYTTSVKDESKYSTSYSYDKHGNIETLMREGLVAANKFDYIDKLSLKYNGNQLINVNDEAPYVGLSSSADFKDKKNTSNVTEYTYNKNGAMLTDLNKGMSVSYNSLNLPREMVINHTSAKAKNYYTYAAEGTKLKTIHKYDPKLQTQPILGSTSSDGSLSMTITTDYVSNKIYENGILNKIQVDNGYIENGKYYFYIKDHLGNNRLITDEKGSIIQSNQYYPFGMMFAENTNQDKQDFKYNGKELDRMHGLNQYDYSARYYDPAISRFTTMDPLAEKYYNISPYVYVANNPLKYVDYRGDSISLAGLLSLDMVIKSNYTKTLISDLQAQTGLTYTLSSDGQLGYTKNSNGSPIVTMTTDDNGNTIESGSATARNFMIGIIDNPTTINIGSGMRSSTDDSKNAIGLSFKQIEDFIQGSQGLDNRTQGWGMTLIHELHHTTIGGGLKDDRGWGNIGAVETQMNVIRSELNKQGGNYGQRLNYEAIKFSPYGAAYIPFNTKTFKHMGNDLIPTATKGMQYIKITKP